MESNRTHVVVQSSSLLRSRRRAAKNTENLFICFADFVIGNDGGGLGKSRLDFIEYKSRNPHDWSAVTRDAYSKMPNS